MPGARNDNSPVAVDLEEILRLVNEADGGLEAVIAKAVKATHGDVKGEERRRLEKNFSERLNSYLIGKSKPRCGSVREIARGVGVPVSDLLLLDASEDVPAGTEGRETITKLTYGWFCDNSQADDDFPKWDYENVEWQESPGTKAGWPSMFPKGKGSCVPDVLVYRGVLRNSRGEVYDFVAERLHRRFLAMTARERTKDYGFQAMFTRYDSTLKLLIGTWHGLSPCLAHGCYPMVLSESDVRESKDALSVMSKIRPYFPGCPVEFREQGEKSGSELADRTDEEKV